MVKEAKIKKFKVAFLKPKHPDKHAQKMKTDLEKAVNKWRKKGDETGGLKSEIERIARAMLQDNDHDEYKKYAEELLSYKLVKHWNDDEDFKLWKENFGIPATLGNAVKLMLTGSTSDDFLKQCAERFADCWQAMDECYKKNPDLLVDYMIKKKQNLPKGFSPTFNCDRLKGKVLTKMFLDGERDDLPNGFQRCVTPDDAALMADNDPQAYYDVFLASPKVTAEDRVAALKNPKVREALAKNNKIWTRLTDKDTDKEKGGVPVLTFFDEAEKHVAKSGTQKDRELSLAEAVFDELLRDGNSLNLTYYTNNFTRPDDALGAWRNVREKLVDEEREKLTKMGYTDMPDKPAAQCDVLVSILTRVVEGALGPDAVVKCKPIVIPEMVLTVPLSKLPGPGGKPGKGGLLPLTFGGNVFEDGATKPNGQVFFTGQGVEHPNAHTYLDVDGVLYDAVLGTKGDDVTKAVAEKFANWESGWTAKSDSGKKLKVAKGDKGSWIIEDENLQAPKNAQGFKTGYRITKNIGQYATKSDA